MTQWIQTEFWRALVENSAEWVKTSAPVIVIILLLAFAALNVLKLMLKRARTLILDQLQKTNSESDITELEKRVDTLLSVTRSASKAALWTVVGMIILRKIGIDIAPLLAGAGIAGIAIGFGAQELVRDFISGFFILLENQIRTGDVAIINETGGLVERISLRTTVLRDLSGTVHIFQNGKINSLSNMTKGWSGAVFDIGVAYKENTDRVVTVMKDVADNLATDPEFAPLINEPIEIFGVDNFGASEVTIKARFKTKPIQQWTVAREYRRRLKQAFDRENIEIPFPHRTLYWGDKIAPPGDRPAEQPDG